jgi:Trimethylamine:corrinoid methyltransferase
MKFSYESPMPSYQILSEKDLKSIHSATLSLMKNVGVRVYGKEAGDIYQNAGCIIDEDSGLIHFPEELVNDSILKAPERYVMCGRNPKDDFTLGSEQVFYTNFGTGIEIVDLETGKRKASDSGDLGNVARFVDAIPEINAFTTAVSSQEAPAHVKDLYEARAVFCNTTKHAILDAENGKNANLVIDMAAVIAGGRDKLRERPFLTLCMCPNSPLEIHEGAAEVIIETARAGLPISMLSMGLVGGTTPATLAGTLVVTNAEILAGIVLSQLVNPGNPVMYGSSTTIMDMQFVSSPVGAPEHGMFGAAVAQLGKYYKIPTKVGGT